MSEDTLLTKEQQHELTIHEFDSLRAELSENLSYMRKLEGYAILSTAVVQSFLFSQVSKSSGFHFFTIVWLFPAIFPVMAYLRIRDISNGVGYLGSYIKKIEDAYRRNPRGWESFLYNEIGHNNSPITNFNNAAILLSYIIIVFIIMSFTKW